MPRPRGVAGNLERDSSPLPPLVNPSGGSRAAGVPSSLSAGYRAEYDSSYAKELGNFRLERISRARADRVFLRHDQRLFAALSRVIFSLIAEFYSTAAGTAISTAAVVAYQPFGDSLRFSPHFRALILEGGFDSVWQLYHLPVHDTARMAECVRRRTIGLFLKSGLITQRSRRRTTRRGGRGSSSPGRLCDIRASGRDVLRTRGLRLDHAPPGAVSP